MVHLLFKVGTEVFDGVKISVHPRTKYSLTFRRASIDRVAR